MATVHAQTNKPDSMAGGFNQLLIVLFFALLAAMLWYFTGKPLANQSHGGAHGEQHAATIFHNKAIGEAA